MKRDGTLGGRWGRIGWLALLLGATVALAAAEAVNTTWRGVAIKGYDPVAYFTVGKPMAGKSQHEYKWKGATWRFMDAANRDRFVREPERYAPQFGGFCAWAVSQGYTAGIDPEAWRVVDGKLYLNYSAAVQRTWEEDVAGNIAKGEAQWPKLRDANE